MNIYTKPHNSSRQYNIYYVDHHTTFVNWYFHILFFIKLQLGTIETDSFLIRIKRTQNSEKLADSFNLFTL